MAFRKIRNTGQSAGRIQNYRMLKQLARVVTTVLDWVLTSSCGRKYLRLNLFLKIVFPSKSRVK
jgi:hypothetical protein